MTEPLRDALRDLNDAAYPHIAPPGVDAVRRTVRRRRSVRAGLAGLAAVAAVAALALPGVLRPTPPPVQATPSTTGSVSVTSTPTDSVSPTLSSAPVGAGATSSSCRPLWAPGWDGSPPRDGKRISLVLQQGPDTVYCSDAKIRVGWVSYVYHTDGRQYVYATDSVYLRPGASATSTVRMASTCAGNIYFFAGDIKSPGTIPVGSQNPPLPPLDPAHNVAGWFDGYLAYASRPPCAYPTTPPPTSEAGSPSPS